MKSITIPTGLSQPGTLVTPRSRLMDQHVPACEIISLPRKSFGGGMLHLDTREGVTVPPDLSRRQKIKRNLSILGNNSVHQVRDAIIVDHRRRSPQNWAHFLTNHLPITFAILSHFELTPKDIILVLPEDTPVFINKAAEVFGFRTLLTSSNLVGRHIAYEAEPWIGIRSKRAEWVRNSIAPKVLSDIWMHSQLDQDRFPKKVFIARRDNRKLENEIEIEKYLTARDYRKIYVEDFPVSDQFRLFENASEIVAIHGAGLAPLLYRSKNAPPCRIIELQPCGIMTDVFRIIAGLVNCQWIGVRGRIKPEYVSHIYDMEHSFVSAAYDDFYIDTASLEIAFEVLDQRS